MKTYLTHCKAADWILPERSNNLLLKTPPPRERRCVYQREDEKGAVGVELNRDLVKVAGKALEKNMTRMGPLVLPMSEQLRFAANFVARKVLGRRDLKPYVPNFTKAFDHFCLHAGALRSLSLPSLDFSTVFTCPPVSLDSLDVDLSPEPLAVFLAVLLFATLCKWPLCVDWGNWLLSAARHCGYGVRT